MVTLSRRSIAESTATARAKDNDGMVRAEHGESAEKFFNKLVFERSIFDELGLIAKGKHWCEPDMYKSLSEFRFRGCDLECLGILYEVKRSNKDYIHES
jgi:hypothetical protein